MSALCCPTLYLAGRGQTEHELPAAGSGAGDGHEDRENGWRVEHRITRPVGIGVTTRMIRVTIGGYSEILYRK